MGFNKPEIISTKVVLPEPLFPIIQIQSFFLFLNQNFQLYFCFNLDIYIQCF